MTIHFEGASDKRKELVLALSEAIGVKSEYLGAPAFDYRVGDYIIHRDGSVEANDLLDMKEIGLVLHALRAHGFVAIGSEWSQPEEAPTTAEMLVCATEQEFDRISLSFPTEGLSEQGIDNLKKLIAAKAPLIRLALEVTELPILIKEEMITFPWLPATASHEMVEATAQLLVALIKLAKKLKRVTATQRDTDNPRYAFRCLLLRLGFIGDVHKQTRQYLMRGIPGNGSKRHIVNEEAIMLDEPVKIEPLEKLKMQTDVVSKAELVALTDENAIDSGSIINHPTWDRRRTPHQSWRVYRRCRPGIPIVRS